MKPNSDTRKPYSGITRSLVIALDVGTTFSGVSYAILEPGDVPKIHGVTRFPGQEHVAGNSKIPSIMYYDKRGKMKAAGAEADTAAILSQAEDEGWVKAELFKLRLRPRTMKLKMNGMRLGPLPHRKNAVDVFGDFLGYLFRCTRDFIVDTHANGAALWHVVEHDLQFVLSHPNGWEGAQQTKMRRAAVYAGLVPDTDKGRARIRFVTEGEASLHACLLNGLAADVLSNPSRHGFLVADAGGGTLDISSYGIRGTSPLVIEEIAPPDCIFAGSVFVSRRAREFLGEKLKNSRYGTADALDHITKRFDETTKRLFRDKKDLQFIPFGSPLDKDLTVGIRGGQLKLTGAEVAELFEPSITAAVAAIKAQIEASSGVIRSVWLVGGFAASPWLFSQLQSQLALLNVTVSRPDTQTSKAVADGAIGFYCDHHVSARVSKFMYGVEYLREFDPQDQEHVARKDRLCELPSGPKLLPDAFDCILARGVKVKESTVFSRKYCTELTSLSMLSVFEVEIWCYRGGNTIPKWILRHAKEFSTLCVVRADLSPLSGSAQAKHGRNGKTYWTIVFSVEIHMGLTEFQARIKWVDDGQTKYGPASIIYNESGHRAEEDEPDSSPEDNITILSTRTDTVPSAPSSRARSQDHHNPPSTNGSSSFLEVPDVVRAGKERSSSKTSTSTPTSPTRTDKDIKKGIDSEQDRGRTTEKGKEKEHSSGRESRTPGSTSSKLADALTSVWGALSPSASSSNPSKEVSKSLDATSSQAAPASPQKEDISRSLDAAPTVRASPATKLEPLVDTTPTADQPATSATADVPAPPAEEKPAESTDKKEEAKPEEHADVSLPAEATTSGDLAAAADSTTDAPLGSATPAATDAPTTPSAADPKPPAPTSNPQPITEGIKVSDSVETTIEKPTDGSSATVDAPAQSPPSSETQTPAPPEATAATAEISAGETSTTKAVEDTANVGGIGTGGTNNTNILAPLDFDSSAIWSSSSNPLASTAPNPSSPKPSATNASSSPKPTGSPKLEMSSEPAQSTETTSGDAPANQDTSPQVEPSPKPGSSQLEAIVTDEAEPIDTNKAVTTPLPPTAPGSPKTPIGDKSATDTEAQTQPSNDEQGGGGAGKGKKAKKGKKGKK